MSLYPSRHVCDGCGKLHIGGWNANSTCVCPDNPYTAPEQMEDAEQLVDVERIAPGRIAA